MQKKFLGGENAAPMKKAAPWSGFSGSAESAIGVLGGFAVNRHRDVNRDIGVQSNANRMVTNADIAQELSKQGLAVLKSQIRMPNGPLKIVGDHPVSVALHTDVTVDVTVTVYGETA